MADVSAAAPSSGPHVRRLRRERPVVVLRSAADLAAFRAGRLGRAGSPLELDLPGLAHEEATLAAERLARLRAACGCGHGTLLGVAVLLASAAWHVLSPPEDGGLTAMRIGLSVVLVAAAVVIGKAAGLLQARLALRRELDALRDRLYTLRTDRPA